MTRRRILRCWLASCGLLAASCSGSDGPALVVDDVEVSADNFDALHVDVEAVDADE